MVNEKPEEKEDDLDATDDGKPTKESHGASDETQLGLCLDQCCQKWPCQSRSGLI